MADHFFQLLVAGVWSRDLDQLHLLELVLAYHSTGIATGGACFGAEAQ